MKTFVVAYINFFENELETAVVKVTSDCSWKDVLIKSGFIDDKTAGSLDDFINTAKGDAFDQDWLFDIVEVTDGL